MMQMRWALSLILVFAAAGMAFSAEEAEGSEEKVPLDQVPAAVKDAATKAVAGLTLTEAEVEVEDGVTVYELDGTADGKEYEVKVTADGKVLKAEQEDEDEDGGEKAGKDKKSAGEDDDDGDDENEDEDDDDK